MHNADFEALNSIEFTDPQKSFNHIELVGNTEYSNQEGLTNDDLTRLSPLFEKVAKANQGTKDFGFNLSNQRITDFSFFNKPAFSRDMDIFATAEFQVFSKNPIYIDPDTFTSETPIKVTSQVLGIKSEPSKPVQGFIIQVPVIGRR